MPRNLELDFVKAYVSDWDNFDNAESLATDRDREAGLILLESILNPLSNIDMTAIAE